MWCLPVPPKKILASSHLHVGTGVVVVVVVQMGVGSVGGEAGKEMQECSGSGNLTVYKMAHGTLLGVVCGPEKMVGFAGWCVAAKYLGFAVAFAEFLLLPPDFQPCEVVAIESDSADPT